MAFFKRHPRSAAVLIALAAALLCAILVFALRLPRDREARLCADVTERDWFCPAVRHLAAAGLLDIDEKTPFSPTERLTRAAAVTLLYRLAGEQAAEGPLPVDVPQDAPCAAAALWASSAGIATGSGGAFRPEEPVTREQLACFLYRYAEYAGLDTQRRGSLEDYHDLALVSEYALEPVSWAEAYDLFNCRSGGALMPKGSVSRALGAEVFSRFLRDVTGRSDGYVPAEAPGRGAQERLWILMYHNVIPDGWAAEPWAVTASQLRADLEWLTSHGYTFYLPGELAEGTRLARKSVMLTFDDGYAGTYTLAFPLLQEYGAKAVIAPVVRPVEERMPEFVSWEMCREMADSGLVELGSHTYALHDDAGDGLSRLPDETPAAYASRVFPDLERSVRRIEEETGQRVYYLAYPNGVTEPYAKDFVEAQFAMSVTTRYGAADLSGGLYDLPRLNIDAETRAAVLGTPRKLFRLYAP